MHKIRIQDIPTTTLTAAFDFFLGGFDNAPAHPDTGHTWEDVYLIHLRLKVEFKARIKLARTPAEKSELRLLLRTTVRELARISELVHDSVPVRMRCGQWVAFGRLGSRLTLIPRSDWDGVFDRHAQTLTTEHRQYTAVQVLSEKATPEEQAAVREFYDAANGDTGGTTGFANTPTRSAGRPSSKHLIVQRFYELQQAGQLKPTLAETARDIARWLPDAHPDLPALSANTIEDHIREPYRLAQNSAAPRKHK